MMFVCFLNYHLICKIFFPLQKKRKRKKDSIHCYQYNSEYSYYTSKASDPKAQASAWSWLQTVSSILAL